MGRAGPYTLIRQIGEGGMGTVYLAEQAHPVRRRVGGLNTDLRLVNAAGDLMIANDDNAGASDELPAESPLTRVKATSTDSVITAWHHRRTQYLGLILIRYNPRRRRPTGRRQQWQT
jgi:serine/threonine protein kinase